MKFFKDLHDKASALRQNVYDTLHAARFDPEEPHKQDAEAQKTASPALPNNTAIAAVTGAFTLSSATATNIILSTLQKLSVLATPLVAGGSAVVGGGIFAGHYWHSRKAAHEVVVGHNMAGQTVEGTRLDLYRLHEAQKKILSLTMDFNTAAAPRKMLEAGVQAIIDGTSETRSRVKVLEEPSLLKWKKADYTFVQPQLTFLPTKPPKAA